MRLLKNYFSNPIVARVAPFLIFLALTYGEKFGPAAAEWFYLAKTLVAVWLVYAMRPFVIEMRWAISWEAIVVGVLVCVMWVGLDPYYPHFLKTGATGNPGDAFGRGSALAWFFIGVHILGMTLVVPPIEEVFYRSFIYRYLARQNFLSVPLGQFFPFPFFATAIAFGFSHNEWLAGILCGMAYQWLVVRKNRLGDAMTAHAITNFLLGVWIVWQGAWRFW